MWATGWQARVHGRARACGGAHCAYSVLRVRCLMRAGDGKENMRIMYYTAYAACVYCVFLSMYTSVIALSLSPVRALTSHPRAHRQNLAILAT